MDSIISSGWTRYLRWLSATLALWCGVFACAQSPPPIADRVDAPLVPAGLTNLAVHMSGQRVHVFEDSDGTSVLHFFGDFELALGAQALGTGRQTARSREAVVWINPREFDGKPYQYLQMILWRDAEIVGTGGAVTAGPVLFVTLNTTGALETHADDISFSSHDDSDVYRQGRKIRAEVKLDRVDPAQAQVTFRVVQASGLSRDSRSLRPRPVIQLRSPGDFAVQDMGAGQRVLTVTGGVYFSRGATGEEDFLELQADSVVVFLPKRSKDSDADEDRAVGMGVDQMPRPSRRADRTRSSPGYRADRDGQMMTSAWGDVDVESVYLEGDVRMSQGTSAVRAARVFYDLIHDRAVILDATIRTVLVENQLPLYLRADELRQLSRQEFVASDAILTTSEFHTPQYHIGASRVELTTRSVGGAGLSGGFKVHDATINVSGVPILYWPYLAGNVDVAETATRGLRTGFSGSFGLELETDWHTFSLLGLETPKGFDSTLSLDYFSERGPAAGVDAKYRRDTYFGDIRSYLMTDNAEDNLGADRRSGSVRDTRGRVLIRHRQYLKEDWQLTLELSYISDRDFLEEFFESEFDNEKEQETLIYLKKQRADWAFTAILQARLMDFLTQTERLPDFAFYLFGQPVGERLTWFSENRIGFVRYRPGDQRFRDFLFEGRRFASGAVARVDTRQEIDAPMDIGPWRFVPFASVRGSAWDDTVWGNGVVRAYGSFGVRGSMYLSQVDREARSELFDLDGVRHVIKPDITAWISDTNQAGARLFPFDETVEGIDGVDGVAVGVRQRWQTKRGAGKTRRKVDFLTWDLELGLFNGATGDDKTNGFVSYTRPELSVARNYLNSSVVWRVNDRTAFLSEVNYDVNDGEIDVLNMSLAVERTPRMSYLVGYRFIEEADSGLFGFDFNYKMTEKHTLAIRQSYDVEAGRTADFTVALIRRFPNWFTALSFELDEAENDFGVTLSIWPQGLPQAALGPRRFTGIADSARLSRN